jgi:hypothetical protein
MFRGGITMGKYVDMLKAMGDMTISHTKTL